MILFLFCSYNKLTNTLSTLQTSNTIPPKLSCKQTHTHTHKQTHTHTHTHTQQQKHPPPPHTHTNKRNAQTHKIQLIGFFSVSVHA